VLSRKFVCSAATLLVLLTACHRSETGATTNASAVAASQPAYVPLAEFPPLGPEQRVERGVVVHEAMLRHNGQLGRIWIYLPAKLPKSKIPAVFIAPAGVPPFVGNSFGDEVAAERNPEHLPYVHAGFAVVAYDLDGDVGSDEPTFEDVERAATAFKNADAGMLNARHAIDYVLKTIPNIDPQRLYSAGHSSAGRISLLLAETDPRIAACIAYAPVTDSERRAEIIAPDAVQFLEQNLTGFRTFLKETSPLQQAARLRVPAFVFHSVEDERIPIADTEKFVDELKKTNANVTFVRAQKGGHYDSMIDEGVPQGIEWLQKMSRNQ